MMRFGISIFAAALAATAAHAADLTVIQSDNSAYVKNDVLDSDQVVQLKSGQKLVLQMPNGRSVTLHGPWDKKPVDDETAFDASSPTKYMLTPPQPPHHTGLTFRGAKKPAAEQKVDADAPQTAAH